MFHSIQHGWSTVIHLLDAGRRAEYPRGEADAYMQLRSHNTTSDKYSTTSPRPFLLLRYIHSFRLLYLAQSYYKNSFRLTLRRSSSVRDTVARTSLAVHSNASTTCQPSLADVSTYSSPCSLANNAPSNAVTALGLRRGPSNDVRGD